MVRGPKGKLAEGGLNDGALAMEGEDGELDEEG